MDLNRHLLFEIDGPGVTPESVDAPLFLDLASAFLLLVRGNAADDDYALALNGLSVVRKCAALAVPVDDIEAAKQYSALALQQINGTADPPYGLTSAVERAKSALKKLPEGHCAIARANGWEGQIRAPSHEAVIPLDAILSIRATPTKVGGVRPSVRFKSRLESDFTLSVTEEQARAIGAFLYKEVDIVAKVSRDSDGAIVRGRLDSFEPVDYGDPRPAWRDWYKSVGGEEWDRMADTRNGLER